MRLLRRHAVVLTVCSTLTMACGREPEDAARRYLENGDALARRGRDAAAVIEYRNALRLTPSADGTYRRLGAALDRLGRTDQSHRAYEMSERFADGRPLPYDESSLRTLVETHPRHVGARLALATLLIEQGESAEAEEHLRAALNEQPAREQINRGLAALYLSQGRVREAEDRLRVAAAACPQRYRSRLALADFLFEQRRWADVREVLDQAQADPVLADAIALRRVALDDKEGSALKARHSLTQILKTRPGAEAWVLEAHFANADGDLQRAERAAREALAWNPKLPAAQSLMESIRWQQLEAARPKPAAKRTAAIAP